VDSREGDEMNNSNDNTNRSGVVAEGSEIAMDSVDDITHTHTPADATSDPLTVTDAIFPVSARPIVVRTATVRTMGARGCKSYSLVMTIPKAVTDVCGLREGDTLLVEAWSNGVIRMTLAGEGL
jgi:hypothetical protein